MLCSNPITAYRSESVNDTGKRSIVFKYQEASATHPEIITIPCGVCLNCKINKAKEWTIRLMNEKLEHEKSMFLTLTIEDKFIPSNGSLVKSDFVNFMKRYREFIYPERIRFYHVGEYGDGKERPHHHAIIFGHSFDDLAHHYQLNNIVHYTSETLSKLWKLGLCEVGDVTTASCAYVARYCQKKLYGSLCADRYQGRLPEYSTMSRRPGIGAKFVKKFSGDIYPHNFIVENGIKFKVPKFYDEILKVDNPELFDKVKLSRKEHMRNKPILAKPTTLEARRLNGIAKVSKYTRGYENADSRTVLNP